MHRVENSSGNSNLSPTEINKIRNYIKENINILDIVSKYVTLKRVGSNYAALSPFKYETKPSFFVSPSKKIFKCFSSGYGGDVIKFVSLIENISELEAIEKIVREYSLPFEIELYDQTSNYHRYVRYYRKFSDYFHSKDKKVLEYLSNRGLEHSFYKLHRIGFADSDILSQQDLDLEYLSGIGLIYFDKAGIARLFGADSLTFPLRNNSDIVGFYYRSIKSSNHLYSKGNEFFKKGEIVFNLHSIKEGVPYIVITEGVLDALSLIQMNYPYTVSTLGALVSKTQMNKILDKTDNVILGLDKDATGIMQTMNIVRRLYDRCNFYVIDYINYKDANDYLRLHYNKSLGSSANAPVVLTIQEYFQSLYEKNIVHRVILDDFLSFIKDKSIGEGISTSKNNIEHILRYTNSNIFDEISNDKVFVLLCLFFEACKREDYYLASRIQKDLVSTYTDNKLLRSVKNDVSLYDCEKLSKLLDSGYEELTYLYMLYEDRDFSDLRLEVAYAKVANLIETEKANSINELIQNLLNI